MAGESGNDIRVRQVCMKRQKPVKILIQTRLHWYYTAREISDVESGQYLDGTRETAKEHEMLLPTLRAGVF